MNSSLVKDKQLIRYICEKYCKIKIKISAVTNGYELDKVMNIIDKYKIKSFRIIVNYMAKGGMNVIEPDGLICPCWNIVALNDKAVGIIPKWRTRMVDGMTPCKTCPVLMLCKGGCVKKNLMTLRKVYAKMSNRYGQNLRLE